MLDSPWKVIAFFTLAACVVLIMPSVMATGDREINEAPIDSRDLRDDDYSGYDQ